MIRYLPRVLLTTLATVLALWLILGWWPLPIEMRFLLSVGVLLLSGVSLWHPWRSTSDTQTLFTPAILPPEAFRGAVLLVLGDSESLFTHQQQWRETSQGWYLRAQSPEQLPLLAEYLATMRPALLHRVSLLLAFMPEKHRIKERLQQLTRGWLRAIAECGVKLNGIPTLLSAIWVSPPKLGSVNESAWFTATVNSFNSEVQCDGQRVGSFTEWGWHADDETRVQRANQRLWLAGAQTWYNQNITSLLDASQDDLPGLKPALVGVCLTPVIAVEGNLWQQHIATYTTLAPASHREQVPIPLPDPLIISLPRWVAVAQRVKNAWLAGGIVIAFSVLAMLASFLNNRQLIQQIGDHLMLYRRLADQPPAPKLEAQQRLRQDSQQLSRWLLHGEPLKYQFGLYQGMRLIPLLEAAINNWSPPLPSLASDTVRRPPDTLHLNSMSLFDVGKAELKAESTNALVNALMGIKAKPGWLIVVSGHTDNTGDAQRNQQLSLKRAEAVRNWMRDVGHLPESCFAVRGYGASRPITTNDTEVGRAANRRVEISLVFQADACHIPDPTAPSLDGDGA